MPGETWAPVKPYVLISEGVNGRWVSEPSSAGAAARTAAALPRNASAATARPADIFQY